MTSTALKRIIINWMFDNIHEFQLLNSTTSHFRSYIYDSNGNYLIGGEDVAEFIVLAEKLLKL